MFEGGTKMSCRVSAGDRDVAGRGSWWGMKAVQLYSMGQGVQVSRLSFEFPGEQFVSSPARICQSRGAGTIDVSGAAG